MSLVLLSAPVIAQLAHAGWIFHVGQLPHSVCVRVLPCIAQLGLPSFVCLPCETLVMAIGATPTPDEPHLVPLWDSPHFRFQTWGPN